MKKVIVLLLGLLFLGVVKTNAQSKPFPQAVSYAGCIKPAVSQATMNSDVSSYYTYWKGKYLKTGLSSLPGGYYIQGEITGSPDGFTPLGSSEGQGYGMVIVALMAGFDANAKTYFDGLYKTARAFRSVNHQHLMGWVVADNIAAQGHFDSATDGDMDIAYALILAHYQWGSGGTINYLQEAINTINAIKLKNVTNNNRLNLGDWDSKTTYDSRPSDWMMDHMRAFYAVTNDQTWLNVINNLYSVYNSFIANYSPNTGLITDFVINNPVQPCPPNFLDEYPETNTWSYNACRVPLRIVMDYAQYGSTSSQTISNKLVNWVKSATGSNAANIQAGYNMNGTPGNDVNYQAAVFIAPFVAASVVNSANQTFLNNGWNLIKGMKENYYNDSYNLQCMLFISGNWWKPEAGSNPAPTVSITAPANNATFTAPAAINIAATASDPGGSVTKVEFFNGTAKLGEDATSPYQFSWTNVGAGNYTITATATDNLGATASTSVAVSVTGCSVPTQPGTITGNATVAAGSSQTYSIAAVSGATSYTWTLPSGWTGASTSTSIVTTAGSTGGNISVVANNACGSSVARMLAVTIGTPSSNLALNKSTTTSSVEGTGLEGSKAVDGSGTTRWASAAGVDPQWIRVDLTTSYNINRVKIVWEAAYASAYQVQVSADGNTWTTIKSVTGNTALTNDWTGLTGTGRYVRVNGTARGTQWGYSIFELEVYGTTGCTVPAQPGSITGNTSVMAGSSQTYSISAVSGATSYTWTLPSGWSGSSTSTSITTTAGTAGGTISVVANNTCGAGPARTLAVTVTTCTIPAQPEAINGNTSVTAGSSQTYSISAVSGATSYTWTLPSGWSGSSTSTSIAATAGNAGGNISVVANNACGSSAPRTLAVTVTSSSTNIALNKSATASSIEGAGFEASKAVDGSGTTRWASIEGVDPQWVRVDLNAAYNINRVKITWEAAYASAYQVQVSTDGSSWTTIKNVTGNTTLTNDWTGLVGSGRYVRINGTARGTAWGYSIFELEVYGTLAGAREAATSARAEEREAGVVIYPNPVERTLSLSVPDDFKGDEMKITDMSGRTVSFQKIGENLYDVSGLPPGLYILRLAKERQQKVEKFLKK
jgi:endo-1,4-beta-D-glucanase Y